MPDQQLIQFILGSLIKIVIIFTLLQVLLMLLAYGERRILGFIQMRLGPNRVGPFGLLQSLADGIKFIFKEDIIPMHVSKSLYILAPIIALIPTMMAIIIYPFGPEITIPGAAAINSFVYSLTGIQLGLDRMNLWVTNFNVGLLYVLAITGLGVYGIVLAGWSSNSKYSLLGGLRSSAQMVSYELGLGLSLIPIMLMSGSLDLVEITRQQSGWGGMHWNIFNLTWGPTGLIAFITYLICAIAETNRVPFDLPEAEAELVAGFHAEYSAMKFLMFYLAEYTNMTTVSVLATVMFLGGWNGPGVAQFPLLGVVWFCLKIFFFLFLYIWLRGTLPRLRYDQLMNFGWKFLIPVALINIILAAVFGLFFA